MKAVFLVSMENDQENKKYLKKVNWCPRFKEIKKIHVS